MQSAGSVVINRPIDEVFRLMNDHVAEWSIIVVEDETIEDTGGVGTRFRTVTEERGKRMEFEGVVTKWEPPTASSIEMSGKMFDIFADYTLEDLGGTQTVVTQNSRVKGKGVFGLFLTVFGGMLKKSSCKALDAELNSLKDFCESYEPAAATG